MDISIEKIDSLMARANVNFKEAKETLEKCDGNLVEALVYLEEKNKIKPQKEILANSNFVLKCKKLMAKLNKARFCITKNDNTLLNIPLSITLLLLIISFPIFIIALIIALLTDCKIRLMKNSGENYSINKSIDNLINID